MPLAARKEKNEKSMMRRSWVARLMVQQDGGRVDRKPRGAVRRRASKCANTSISWARVVRELGALVRIHGIPVCMVSDNRTEFTSNATLTQANDNGAEWPGA